MKKRYFLKEGKKRELLEDRKIICLAGKLNTSSPHLIDIFNSKKDCSATTALALIFLKENYDRVEEVLNKYFEVRK